MNSGGDERVNAPRAVEAFERVLAAILEARFSPNSMSLIRHGLDIKDLSALSSPQVDAASEHIKQYCS